MKHNSTDGFCLSVSEKQPAQGSAILCDFAQESGTLLGYVRGIAVCFLSK